MKAKTTNMTIGNPAKLMLSFAFPILISNVFQQLYTVTDSAIIAQGVGSAGLAAIGAVDWLVWVISGSILGVATGFSIWISQKYGAGDECVLRKSAAMIGVLSMGITILYSCIFLLFLKPILEALHTPAEIWDMAYDYCKIVFAGTFAVMAFNALAALFRGVGDSVTPLKAQVISTIINIVLDAVAIFRMGMGMRGAAYATVVAQIFSVLYCLLGFRKLAFLHPKREEWRLDIKIIGNLLLLGLPLAARNLLAAFGGIVMQTVINQYDLAVMAGYSATNKLYGCLTAASSSYGQAVAAFTGQNYGAGHRGRIVRGIRVGTITAVITSCIISVILFIGGEGILSLFISGREEPNVMAYAVNYLHLFAIFLICQYINAVFSSALEGIGISQVLFFSGVFGFLTRAVLIHVLPYFWGVDGVWYPEVTSWAVEMIVVVLYYAMKMRENGEAQKIK